ncbi:MAG: hypothetical protein ACON4Z_07670 [Planctomycetota bacterium]
MSRHLPLRSTAAGLAAAALAAALPSQGATFTNFGSPSGDTFAGQHLAVTGLPQLGSTFTLEVQYATPPFFCLQVVTPWSAWLALGASNQSWQGLPLPASLPLGFDLLVSPDAVSQWVVNSNTSCPPGVSAPFPPVFAVTVPNQPGLVGLALHAQVVMARFGAPAAALPLATDGGTATVGL